MSARRVQCRRLKSTPDGDFVLKIALSGPRSRAGCLLLFGSAEICSSAYTGVC